MVPVSCASSRYLSEVSYLCRDCYRVSSVQKFARCYLTRGSTPIVIVKMFISGFLKRVNAVRMVEKLKIEDNIDIHVQSVRKINELNR